MKFITLIFSILSNWTISAQAQSLLPELVEIPLVKAYIPRGFDSNDRVQVVVEGKLPNACYTLGPTETEYQPNTNTIAFVQRAYLYKSKNSICKTIKDVPFKSEVLLGLLGAGAYDIFDGRGSRSLGTLNVAAATNEGPDDFIYAIIEDAQMNIQQNKKVIAIRGVVPNSCWSVKETRVLVESDDVITLLPIMAYVPKDCSPSTVPLFTTVKLPTDLKNGRYLVQIRSLNGQSVNKILDL